MLEKMHENKKYVKTIAVASGKGGVGKTNIVANLAIAMKMLGNEVLIMDADLGLSSIDVLLNLAPRYNIQHVIKGYKRLKDVILEGPRGIKIIPASSGIQELTFLNEFQRLRILEEFNSLTSDTDVLIIDTAPGISENVAFFCIAAQQIVIVTSQEPTAMTDAYALIKVLFTKYQEKEFFIIVNSVKNHKEGLEVFRRLSLASEKFLNVSLDYLGYIPCDTVVPEAVKAQKTFVDIYPDSLASRQVFEIASKVLNSNNRVKGTLQFFIGNLISGPHNLR
ncbi:MAG: MinD/ParA family protein [Thermodesulfovibrionales bacterium]